MKVLSLFIGVIAICVTSLSCNDRLKEKQQTSNDSLVSFPEARIRLSMGSFWGRGPGCMLKHHRGKTDTLYVAHYKNVNGKDSMFLFRQPLLSHDCDSLLQLTLDALRNLHFDENPARALDGLHVSLSIAVNSSALEGSWSELRDTRDLPKEIQNIIRFINRRLPKEQQLQ